MDNSQIQYYRGLIRQLEANLTNAINRIKVLEEKTKELTKKSALGVNAPSTLDVGAMSADKVVPHDHTSQEEGGDLDTALGIHNHSSDEQGGPAYAVYYPD